VSGQRDVLLYNGQQPNTPWRPGEKNTLTITIFLPPNYRAHLNSSNFDELISNVDVKRRPSPDFASASTAANDSKAATGKPDSSQKSLGARLKEMDREHNIQRCNSGVAVACDELGNSYKKDSEKSADRESDLATAVQYYQKACSMGFQGGCRHANSLAQGEPKK
jgi:TPR repeat protein